MPPGLGGYQPSLAGLGCDVDSTAGNLVERAPSREWVDLGVHPKFHYSFTEIWAKLLPSPANQYT